MLFLELLLQFTKRADAEKLREIFLKVCLFSPSYCCYVLIITIHLLAEVAIVKEIWVYFVCSVKNLRHNDKLF